MKLLVIIVPGVVDIKVVDIKVVDIKVVDIKVVDIKVADIKAVEQFLSCATPDAWVETALTNLDMLLIDHANCEKKAASTALSLIYRYTEHHELLTRLSKLAREELRHFEQVIQIMKRRGVTYDHLPACSYAGEIRKLIRPSEPHRLVDTLIASALIEARSCERFAKLSPYLDEELQAFYASLLKSEARHFQDYLKLAEKFAVGSIDARIRQFAEKEQQLIQAPCSEFRFHSGPLS